MRMGESPARQRAQTHIARMTKAHHPVGHRKRGVARRAIAHRAAGASALATFLAVLGPGLLAGLSDDDPAGLTTYSVLGTDYGYRYLWIIPASVILLIFFQLIAVRVGAVTGKGLVAVVRERWGVRAGYVALVGLLLANFGTICAEYAGVAAAGQLIGIPAWISVPIAATVIALVVVFGSFHRVEHVLLLLSSTLALYVIDGVLAHPDWGAVRAGLVVPNLPDSHAAWLLVAATIGTTLAPWGLAFIQSYAVDKKLAVQDLAVERWDVVVGALLTGLIGVAVAVACAATLHRAGIHIDSAGDAAAALRPLAGRGATLLFGVGLLGASLLAAVIVPLATSYSMAEAAGRPASLSLKVHQFQWFYAAFVVLTALAVAVVITPGLPLIPLIVGSQVVNAVLLPLHLVLLLVIGSDATRMGANRLGRTMVGGGAVGVVLVVACVLTLLRPG
jgi:Mn2+/Fe2+ NRAMP family transporter